MGKRVKIGDIFEIETTRGLAYAQCILKDKNWGELIRIIEGFYPARPESFRNLVNDEDKFVTFFPLQAAINQKIFQVVANEGIPEGAEDFSRYRKAGFRDREGKVKDWWIYDGKRKGNVFKLSPGEAKLPILQVINDTLLIERIEEDWTPEKDI